MSLLERSQDRQSGGAPPRKQPSTDSKGVQSIEVGGKILRALCRRATPLMLKELAQEAGMSPTKAHPHLVSFCSVGLVEQDPASGSYRLGALALRLGLASLTQSHHVQRAVSALDSLTGQARHTAAISVWDPHGPTVVHRTNIEFPLDTNLRVGSLMSVVSTATGRVFAAFLPERTTAPLVNVELSRLAKTRAERTQQDAAFRSAVEEVRKRQMARALGNPLPGINALSAPVFSEGGAVALVITLLGRAESFDASWDGPIAKQLMRCCQLALTD